MKKLIGIASALSLAALLAACSSSSSSEASLAEECSNGVSANCLTAAASWNLNALYQDDLGQVMASLTSPTSIVFKKDGFNVTYSMDPKVDGDNLLKGETDDGTWTFENGKLTLQFSHISNTTNGGSTKVLSPAIVTLQDGSVGLVLGLNMAALHTTAANPFVEIYTGIEK